MRMPAEISLCNRLTVSLLRARADKWSVAQLPEEVPPNTTLAWQVEDEGSVTYDLAPEDGERGVVKRFTLQWSLAPDGVVHCLVQDAARNLSIQIEQRPDGVLCTVTLRRRRVPPPPRRGRLLARLIPVTAGILVVTLLGAALTALGSPIGDRRGGTPTPHAPPTATTTATRSPGTLSPAKLAVSPGRAGNVDCSAASVGYPAITLRNAGGKALHWRASATGPGASLSPASGTLDGGKSQTLSVRQPGAVTSAAAIAITSDGGNATLTFACMAPPPPSSPPPPPTVPPQLAVQPTQPTTVNCFGSSVAYPSITVRNTGGQTLTWSATSSNGAASLSPGSGSVAPGSSQQLQVSQAGPTSTATTVSVSSNGGNATVSFSCIPASAQLKVTQNQNAGETCSGPVAPPYAVTLDNTGSNVSVGWQFDAASYGSWASAAPASGTVSAGQAASFQVTPNTCAAAGQAHTYQAALHLSFPQGGSEPDIALIDATTGPPLPPPNLTVNYTQVGLGGACGSSATVTLGNSGGQTLNWSATTTNGFTVSPTGGSIAGSGTMVITISGTPIDPSQSGYVYITSNGGNATITISYGCPF